MSLRAPNCSNGLRRSSGLQIEQNVSDFCSDESNRDIKIFVSQKQLIHIEKGIQQTTVKNVWITFHSNANPLEDKHINEIFLKLSKYKVSLHKQKDRKKTLTSLPPALLTFAASNSHQQVSSQI